jgi:2-oxoglutarate dehydrogenase complex dehydrogenase (E1) component-like enzyme
MSQDRADVRPIQGLRQALAPLELHNSPLSELACMGFEYGYSQEAPETFVLWEAQFGDFVNSAQVIIDQFIVSGLAKWGQTSRLTLLLPHGYEGQGPEHSSARLERFLALAAEGNIRVASPTTPAQYFHLLRRQARIAKQRPLVIMTPKSLLRLPQAASSLADLAEDTRFHPVLAEPGVDEQRVTRLVMCEGKIYYDLVGHRTRAASDWRRASRAAVSVPRGADPRVDGPLSGPQGGRVGAGGAAQRRRARTHVPAPDADHARRHPLRLHRPPRARQSRRGIPGGTHHRTEPHRDHGDRLGAADLPVPA